jgi:pimeloyl-ACP methyl ester carboxylesterase
MNAWYQSNGDTLGYRDAGTGIPVVFLHPTPLDRDYWRPMIEGLGGVRAIVADLRGHGLSDLGHNLPLGQFALVPNAPALTMSQFAADALALLDHLNLADAIFVGCSVGGSVVLELWRKAPARMRGLAFICSKPQPETEASRQKRAANIAQVRAEGTEELFDAMARTLVGATARDRHPRMVEELRARMMLTPEAAVAVQAGLALRPDSVPTIATIDVPVFVIAGGEDPGATTAELQAFQAAPGGCEFHLLPDAGHFAAYEQPEKIASLLAEWLRQPQA